LREQTEAKYGLSTESHSLGWQPKLSAHYYNINSNDSYKVYTYMCDKRHHPKIEMPVQDCVHNLTYSNLQQGDGMRKRGYGAPPSASKDMATSNWQPFTPTDLFGFVIPPRILMECKQ
jgi:hypothetical protein